MIPMLEKTARFAISIVGFPLSLYQAVASYHESNKYKAVGRLVNIGSRNLHAIVTGESAAGKPTIILESGMGGCSLDWSLVQPELSKHTTVISYDRAGFGWSTETMEHPTIRNYVADLRNVLKISGLQPPYLLVGHSYGGMMIRLFAAEYPDEVTGMVLVDSTHESRYLAPNMGGKRSRERASHLKQFRLGYMLSPIAIPRMVKRHIGSKRLPSEAQPFVVSLGYRNNAYKAVYSELLGTTESAVQLQEAQPLREDLPVIILTAGKNNDEEWQKGQQQLLRISTQTKQIIVEDSWHSIQIHRPDAVIEAVLSLL